MHDYRIKKPHESCQNCHLSKFVGMDFGNEAIACLNCLVATKWIGCMTLRVMALALNKDNIKWEFSHI